MTLKVGDTVELVGLHPAHPTSGVIRHIVGGIYGVHQCSGAHPFYGSTGHETWWVTAAAIRDPNAPPKSLFRRLLDVWRSL
jgi:hypothetical protein